MKTFIIYPSGCDSVYDCRVVQAESKSEALKKVAEHVNKKNPRSQAEPGDYDGEEVEVIV